MTSLLGSPSSLNEYYSQAAQDQFVYTLLYRLLDKQDDGYYLEIGAWDPILINNSYFFEKNLNWKGVSIDLSNAMTGKWRSTRINPLLIEDATQSDYGAILEPFPGVIDYLSLDIDGHYDTVLTKLPLKDYIFKIITIEHDFYQHGEVYRAKEREILKAFGYQLICSNVMNGSGPYEDWWIHPSAFPESASSMLTALDLETKEHQDIMEILQTAVEKFKSSPLDE